MINIVKMWHPCFVVLCIVSVSECLEWNVVDRQTLAQISLTMNSVLDRLDSVEKETTFLRNENKRLKNLLMKTNLLSKVQSTVIKQLKEEIVQTKDQVRNLEGTVAKHSHNLDEKYPIPDQPKIADIAIVNGTVENKTAETSPTNDKNDKREGNTPHSKIRRLLVPLSTKPTVPTSAETRAAFSARAMKDITGLVHNHPILFDHIDVNIGHNFDPSLGVFTCPVPGYYFFTATLTSRPGNEANADIVLNGKRLGSLFAGDDIGSDAHHGYETASTSVITHCMKGDHVWMKLLTIGDQLKGDLHSGFEGFLIWSD